MARRIKYRFGKEEFTSQNAIMKHSAALRERYGIGSTVSGPEDIAFLRDLVSSHIHSEVKTGVGIIRFFVDYAPEHSTSCFWLERSDGVTTDFGVPACLKKVGQLNKQSLREAIAPQLDAFKVAKLANCIGIFNSEYSGKSFPVDEAVADHIQTLDTIVHSFFSRHGVDIHIEMLTRSVDASSKEHKEHLNA